VDDADNLVTGLDQLGNQQATDLSTRTEDDHAHEVLLPVPWAPSKAGRAIGNRPP